MYMPGSFKAAVPSGMVIFTAISTPVVGRGVAPTPDSAVDVLLDVGTLGVARLFVEANPQPLNTKSQKIAERTLLLSVDRICASPNSDCSSGTTLYRFLLASYDSFLSAAILKPKRP